MSEIWIPKSVEDDLAQYKDAEPLRKPHGVMLVNGKEVADTLMCPHCGEHFFPRKGQPRLRCVKHNAKVCDKPLCNTYCFEAYPDDCSVREV